MIFGKEWSQKSSVGNAILGRKAFKSQDWCKATTDSRTVIITPNLLDHELIEEDIQQTVQDCLTLCGPGLQAYVLVTQPKDFTEDDYKRMKKILTSVHEQALQCTLVVKFLSEDKDEVKSDALCSVIKDCGDFYSFGKKHDQDHQTEILEKIENIMFKEYHQQSQASNARNRYSHPGRPPKTEPLNLMLFGKKETEKESTCKTLLSLTHSKRDLKSNFWEYQDELYGYTITLFQMPSLANPSLSQEEILKKCHYCISQCVPGIDAFLLALPNSPLTDEDKEELHWIQESFGPFVKDYIKILHTNMPGPKDRAMTNLRDSEGFGCIELHRDKQETFKKIKDKTGKCFTSHMFVEAQLENKCKLQTEVELKKRQILELESELSSSEVVQIKHSTAAPLRIVLIEKTGVGKSAAANTILKTDAFQSQISGTSVTKCCQKETGIVDGRFVAVVDTPGLFDTNVSREAVKNEILKCITFLAPGPHVFLLVLSLANRMTPEEKETLKLIRDTFGTNATRFTIVLFTRGGDLGKNTIEDYIKNTDPSLQRLISDCDERYHVFNNSEKTNHKQVIELMHKIDRMVFSNGGACYTNELFQAAEKGIKENLEKFSQDKSEMLKEVLTTFTEDIKTRVEEHIRATERERVEGERHQIDKEEYRYKRRHDEDKGSREDTEVRGKKSSEDEALKQKWNTIFKEVESKSPLMKEREELKREQKIGLEEDNAAWQEWTREKETGMVKGDEKSQKEIQRLQEESERERDEEKTGRKKEDEDMEEELKRKLKGIEEGHQKKLELLIKKHEDDAWKRTERLKEYLEKRQSIEIEQLKKNIIDSEAKYNEKCVIL